MDKFRVGMKIVVTESESEELYPNGTIGEIVAPDTSMGNGFWWVSFEEGSEE